MSHPLRPERITQNRVVSLSVYDACHDFRLFQHTSFGKHCGIITTFEPNASVISQEPPNSERFVRILEKHDPTWREARAELNELPHAADH